jgi:hypothetical protein
MMLLIARGIRSSASSLFTSLAIPRRTERGNAEREPIRLIKLHGENGIRITAYGRGVKSQRPIRILTSDHLPAFDDE